VVRSGATRAIGTPSLDITTSSLLEVCSRMREKRVFASY
jgi:hypothetical protein